LRLSILSDLPAFGPLSFEETVDFLRFSTGLPLLRGEGWGEVNDPLPLVVRNLWGTCVSYKVDAGASALHLTSILSSKERKSDP
jgi:hypothetical protein